MCSMLYSLYHHRPCRVYIYVEHLSNWHIVLLIRMLLCVCVCFALCALTCALLILTIVIKMIVGLYHRCVCWYPTWELAVWYNHFSWPFVRLFLHSEMTGMKVFYLILRRPTCIIQLVFATCARTIRYLVTLYFMTALFVSILEYIISHQYVGDTGN